MTCEVVGAVASPFTSEPPSAVESLGTHEIGVVVILVTRELSKRFLCEADVEYHKLQISEGHSSLATCLIAHPTREQTPWTRAIV